jgi:two-component system OmpR family response regulator
MSEILTVLYAEDEADIRSVTEFSLEDEGFELVPCASGQEAMDKAMTLTPDLILLDVMMPGMDGPTTLKKLRQLPHLATTPVIFMTAKVQPAEVAEYKVLGALGVISKPFDPMTLADEIRKLLDSRNE